MGHSRPPKNVTMHRHHESSVPLSILPVMTFDVSRCIREACSWCLMSHLQERWTLMDRDTPQKLRKRMRNEPVGSCMPRSAWFKVHLHLRVESRVYI